jgi:hypothetical protein
VIVFKEYLRPPYRKVRRENGHLFYANLGKKGRSLKSSPVDVNSIRISTLSLLWGKDFGTVFIVNRSPVYHG